MRYVHLLLWRIESYCSHQRGYLIDGNVCWYLSCSFSLGTLTRDKTISHEHHHHCAASTLTFWFEHNRSIPRARKRTLPLCLRPVRYKMAPDPHHQAERVTQELCIKEKDNAGDVTAILWVWLSITIAYSVFTAHMFTVQPSPPAVNTYWPSWELQSSLTYKTDEAQKIDTVICIIIMRIAYPSRVSD